MSKVKPMRFTVPPQLGPIVWIRSDGIARGVVAALGCGIAAYGYFGDYAVFLLSIVPAAFFVVRVFIHPPQQLRLHENGISSFGLLGVRWITTTDLTGFRYTSKSGTVPVRDRVVNAAIATLEFRGHGGNYVRHRAVIDTEWKLTEIQGFGIRTVLSKMAESIRNSHVADWTPTMRITADGIDYRRSASEIWLHLTISDFRQGREYTLGDGAFRLLATDDASQVIHCGTTDAVNCFPGFYLMKSRFPEGDERVFAWGRGLSSFEKWRYGVLGSWW